MTFVSEMAKLLIFLELQALILQFLWKVPVSVSAALSLIRLQTILYLGHLIQLIKSKPFNLLRQAYGGF